MKEISRDELARGNGKNGSPAYVAYSGRVYDVSHSFLWQKGTHQASHKAGEDLTEELAGAPHGADFLERFPVVGILKE
ncbi:MAG TPA: cytochrome B5 [Candidatus Methanoperedenaceae archaeon]|nr:cytochrome B5 [Candidatus Methanoperedenaceae archaeon]